MKPNPHIRNEKDEEIKELVIARIEARMSPNLKLSIGGSQTLRKDEMIKHVKEGDSIGKQIIHVHLNFIKAQVSGNLISALNKV
ncbi:MAG: hypothetical protein KKG60_01765 [Nanoarchaeota archaeon]|nr:hypothetical protein [Nanoarchaeota archaeon]